MSKQIMKLVLTIFTVVLIFSNFARASSSNLCANLLAEFSIGSGVGAYQKPNDPELLWLLNRLINNSANGRSEYFNLFKEKEILSNAGEPYYLSNPLRDARHINFSFNQQVRDTLNRLSEFDLMPDQISQDSILRDLGILGSEARTEYPEVGKLWYQNAQLRRKLQAIERNLTLYESRLQVKPRIESERDFNRLIESIDRTAADLKGTSNFNSPIEWRKRGASFGLTALDLPKEFGGSALAPSKMVQVFKHLGQYALDLRDVAGGAHVRTLLGSEIPYQKEIIQKVADGNGYIAIALTEAETGSNISAMKSYAEKVEGGFLLTGSKMYNARYTTASHVVIFAQSSKNSQKGSRLSAFIVPMNHPGIEVVQLEAHGLKGNSFGGINFNKIFVPKDALIGAEGDGGKLFRRHFGYWRVMMAAAAVGTGIEALKQVQERMRSRNAFGGPIGRFTHIQQELAQHTAKLHMASLLVSDVAAKLDQGQFDAAEPYIAMLKAEGVEIALEACDFALRVFGAEGYSNKTDLSQRVADLMGLRIADGTTEVMRSQVVRLLLGEDFWEMAVRP